MRGPPHPALAALHAGGGAPGRAMADALAAGAWIAALLGAPRPRFLEEDTLAPLLTPSSPGEVLESVLARLAADDDPIDPAASEAGGTIFRDPVMSEAGATMVRDPATAAAEIAAHALAAAGPAIRSDRGTGAAASKRARAARNDSAAVAPRAAIAPSHMLAEAVAGRPAWVAEAARIAAESPIRIAAGPPLSRPAPTARSREAGQEAPGGPAAAPVPALDPESRRRRQVVGSGSRLRTAPDFGLAQVEEKAAEFESVPATGPVRATAGEAPLGAGTRARPMAFDHPSSDRAAAPAPATARTEARIGGFAGLAALGRGAPPHAAAPHIHADGQVPPRPPSRESGSPPAGAPADARALLDELTETLRLEILAAGIDLSRRRR